MDPVSVSTAIIGLISAASSLTNLLQTLKNGPKSSQAILLEVNTINTCLSALQRFLSGSIIAARSRTSLIKVEEIQVVLTECVTIFSELKETLDKLGKHRQKSTIDRIKWASKAQIIANLLLRLQGSRMSLNLMLTTLNWSVNDFYYIVSTKSLQNNRLRIHCVIPKWRIRS